MIPLRIRELPLGKALALVWILLPWSLWAAERSADLRPETVAEGRRIYNQSCTVCHGLEGDAGDRAPGLGVPGRRYARRTDSEIFDAIVNGVPGAQMPPMGLSEEEAWKVVSYIRSLRAVAADVPPPGDPERGAEIFWGKGECGRCHTAAGRGGLLGPDLSNLGGERSVAQIREALTVAKAHPPRGYRPLKVVTTDGQTIRGIAKNESNFSLQVLGEDGELYTLAASEIAAIDYAEESLMPADYDRRLSAEEFQDLMAYLSRLVRRSPDPGAARGQSSRTRAR